MSIGALSIGEAPIGDQGSAASSGTKKPPKRRQVVAKADRIAQPEAR